MKKLKLMGVAKSDNHIYYIFKKEQTFFEMVRHLTKELHTGEGDIFGLSKDKWGGIIWDKEENIRRYTDERFSFEDEAKEYYVEVVFGKDRVFLMIHTKKDEQQKIAGILNKFIK